MTTDDLRKYQGTFGGSPHRNKSSLRGVEGVVLLRVCVCVCVCEGVCGVANEGGRVDQHHT